MFTWVHDVAVHSPLLLVSSTEVNSGKSTVISYLVRRSLSSVSISGPALFRSIEKWSPAFVLDENDSTFVNNEDVREVINSGWTRCQDVIRCDPDTHEPRLYSTLAPKALEMKGRKLPDTALSRSVVIEPKRKLPGGLLPGRDRHQGESGDRQLHRCAVTPVAAHQAQVEGNPENHGHSQLPGSRGVRTEVHFSTGISISSTGISISAVCALEHHSPVNERLLHANRAVCAVVGWGVFAYGPAWLLYLWSRVYLARHRFAMFAWA
jgi:hypothetical protein